MPLNRYTNNFRTPIETDYITGSSPTFGSDDPVLDIDAYQLDISGKEVNISSREVNFTHTSGIVTFSGTVGVGTTVSNLGYKLNVFGKSYFNDDFQINGNTFYVDTVNNRVGIGTTNPNSQSKLNVSGSGRFTAIGGFIGDSDSSNVPIVAEVTGLSGSTFFGAINPYGYHGFAINFGGVGLASTQRGYVEFYDKNNGDWQRSIVLNQGNVGIGTTNPGEKLQVDGNVRVGISSISNYIAFRGTTGDNPGLYDHTYVGERIWDPASERSELLLFKGNDADINSGPDRIRLAAGEIRFDTYTVPTSGTFEGIGTSVNITNKLIITGLGNVGIGTSIPSGILQVGAGNTAFTISQFLSPGGPITGAGVSVGIGRTNPNFALDVYGGIGATTLTVSGVSTFVGFTTFRSGAIIAGAGLTIGLGATASVPSFGAAGGSLSFVLTSNTNLRVTVRGTDGVIRFSNITLA